jgi:hypothetical protein
LCLYLKLKGIELNKITTLPKTLSIAIALAACCFTVSTNNLSAATAPVITYTASGTFASTPISGTDTLKLAGEPFSVSIAISESTAAFKTGSNWAAYNKLKLTGTVYSGLLGTSPVTVGSSEATIIQGIDPGKYDVFIMEAPLKVVGIGLTIKAHVQMPAGTIAKTALAPFSTVTLAAGTATVTYSDGSASTELGIQTGTLTATVPSGSATASKAAVVLHSNGAQAVTLHQDGTVSVRPVGEAPVDLGMSMDAVTLKFYATGVSGASEVSVRIAGDEVPVVYAAASGFFPGLDEVVVQAPSSLAGHGATTVTLTADGQAAEPVHIQIQ